MPARLRSMPRHAVEVLVQGLARVLLEVRARQADRLLSLGQDDPAATPPVHDGNLVLADLVALGQVRIEVVLAREHRAAVDRVPPTARPNRTASSTAAHWRTGSTPGSAMSTAAGLRVRRARRTRSTAPENILLVVSSCACVSMPTTISQATAATSAAGAAAGSRRRGPPAPARGRPASRTARRSPPPSTRTYSPRSRSVTLQRPAAKRRPPLVRPAARARPTAQVWPAGATVERHSRLFSLPCSTA